MCGEHEPLTCHRCLLVGRRLLERGNDLARILRHVTVEPNEVTEERLLTLTRQADGNLFAPRAERFANACRHQRQRGGCQNTNPNHGLLRLAAKCICPSHLSSPAQTMS